MKKQFYYRIIILISILAVSVSGQWNGDPTRATPVCVNDDLNFMTDITSNEAGDVFVIYSTGPQLSIQKLVNGVQQWGPDGLILSTGSESAYVARIISDDAGGAIVVWDDYRSDTRTLYAQRVSSAGDFLWGENGLVVPSQGATNEFFQIAPDRHSGVIIAYSGNRNHNWNIYAIRIADDGSFPWGTTDIVVCGEIHYQFEASVCTDSLGNAIVAWHDNRSGNDNMYAQRISLSGELKWASDGITVCGEDADQNVGSICADDKKGAVICWYDKRNGVQQIYGQRIDSTGTRLWDAAGVPICTDPVTVYKKQMIADGKNGAIITWETYGAAIVTQRVNVSGNRVWPEEGIRIYEPAYWGAHDPSMAGDGAAGAYYCWWGTRVSSEDIFAQRVDSFGNVLWQDGGVPLCTADRKQDGCKITPDGNGGAVAAWSDNRVSGNSDIYASRVLPTGDLTGISSGIPNARHFMLEQNYPNPFNPETTIKYHLTGAGHVKLVIYDGLGRVVKTLVNEMQPAGSYTVHVNASPWASGVYFYRLWSGDKDCIRKMILLK